MKITVHIHIPDGHATRVLHQIDQIPGVESWELNAPQDQATLDRAALDRLNYLLSAEEWPGASGMEDVCEIVRATGREEIPNVPASEWGRH